MISFKGDFVIFAAKLKDDSLLLKERLLSHNGEFVSIKGWKNNGGNVVFNGWIVIEPYFWHSWPTSCMPKQKIITLFWFNNESSVKYYIFSSFNRYEFSVMR